MHINHSDLATTYQAKLYLFLYCSRACSKTFSFIPASN